MRLSKYIVIVIGIAGLLVSCAPLRSGSPSPTTPPQKSFTLVKNGASDYEIIVSPSAFPITMRAAEDLRDYIGKATGALLPIRTADNLGAKPAIVIGDSPIAKELGVTIEGIAPEGFRIKTVDRHLLIIGRDTDGDPWSDNWRAAPQSGTWYGVADFLEKYLDIRWFMPGEDGEYVPKSAKLEIPDIDFQDAPRMIYRRMTYLSSNNNQPARKKDVVSWLRRNRNGWSVIWSASHTWVEHFRAETYFKEHPNWFALVNGRRVCGNEEWQTKICTTSGEALDEFANVIIKYSKENPNVMFSLSPNDGCGFCECDQCRSLDREKFPNGMPVLTDRIMTYANEVAARVCKVVPSMQFGIYAYSYYSDPPTYVNLHPNVYVMEVENDIDPIYYSEEFRNYHLNKRLLPWKSKVNNLFFYSHPEGFGGMDLPVMHFTVIKELFKNLDKAKIKGYSMCNITSFAASGLNNYLSQKMCWNPGADIDAIYADALKKCYGDLAAPELRSYFDLVETHMKKWAVTATNNVDISMGVVKSFPKKFEIAYPGLYDEGMPLLKKADSLTVDKGQKSRIRLLIDNLEYTKKTLEMYELSKKVMDSSEPSKDDVLRVSNMAIERRKYLLDNQDTNLFANYATGVEYIEKQFNLPFSPESYDYLLLKASGGRAKAEAMKATGSINLDGVLDDASWEKTPRIQVVYRKEYGSKSDISTVARILYDKENIYIGVECPEPLMKDIKDAVTKRDGPVWEENEVEIFIDTANEQKSFYQLLVNTLGCVADFRNDNGKTCDWDAKAKVVVNKAADNWSVEIAIPYSALDCGPPLPGDTWGLNICRVRPLAKPAEYTCFSPTFGLFNQPKRFGYVVFKE